MAGSRRGPAPKTKAQREQDGSRKRRAQAIASTLRPVESIDKPEWINGYAEEFWNRYAPILMAARFLTEADIPALEAASRSYARWRDLDQRLSTGEIPMVITGPKGNEYVNPLVYARDASEKMWRLWCREFGLTPMSRRGVAPIEETKARANPIEDRLKVIG